MKMKSVVAPYDDESIAMLLVLLSEESSPETAS
jgi:hypothetical protein